MQLWEDRLHRQVARRTDGKTVEFAKGVITGGECRS